jgi:hypothetical protein
VRRLLPPLVVAAIGASLVVGVAPAGATNECRGLIVCVKVAGPWVVVPAARSAPRPRVDYQLSCPRGFVVGGLDAELSDRAIDITFAGKLGSPVGPGVTTERTALFTATYTGSGRSATSFRPRLGCLPASGGGSGPVPYRASAAAAFPPGDPSVRRVRTVHLRPGTIRARQGCGAGELLVSGWHAVGFYTARPPDGALAASVTTTRLVRDGRVSVVARVGTAASGVRADLQIGAVCGGGR